MLASTTNRRGSHSEGESDDEDKDYTVYECPGLAPVSLAVTSARGGVGGQCRPQPRKILCLVAMGNRCSWSTRPLFLPPVS